MKKNLNFLWLIPIILCGLWIEFLWAEIYPYRSIYTMDCISCFPWFMQVGTIITILLLPISILKLIKYPLKISNRKWMIIIAAILIYVLSIFYLKQKIDNDCCIIETATYPFCPDGYQVVYDSIKQRYNCLDTLNNQLLINE